MTQYLGFESVDGCIIESLGSPRGGGHRSRSKRSLLDCKGPELKHFLCSKTYLQLLSYDLPLLLRRMSSQNQDFLRIRWKAKTILSDFTTHEPDILRYTQPTNQDVASVMGLVLVLSESVETICVKDHKEYFEQSQKPQDGSTDAALQKLQKLSSDAYTAISTREENLNTELYKSQKVEEKMNDFIGRAEIIEQEFRPLQAALDKEISEASAQLDKARKDADQAHKDLEKAKEQYYATKDAIEAKRSANKNFFTGVQDWVTRKDVSFPKVFPGIGLISATGPL